MGEQRIFNRPDKDFRTMYANTFIADLKEYAGKHNLDIFVKEYEVDNEWKYFGDLYRSKEFHVAAIMFSGIVSKINNLEYIIQYDSTRSRVEFLMMSPKFRENCQAGDTDTIRYPINHFYTFLPIKYVLVISCFIAMHCSCVSKNCNLMSLGLV